jgi:hypothetical protein
MAFIVHCDPAARRDDMRYNVAIAYILWLFSGFGALGFHRFYLGKTATGCLWFLTGGLAMVGAVYDAFTLPKQVHKANVKAAVAAAIEYGEYAGRPVDSYAAGVAAGASSARPESAEKTILRVAKKNNGFVSPGEVALEGDLSVEQARKELEKLAAAGNAEMRVRQSGVVVYFFPEFAHESNDNFAV